MTIHSPHPDTHAHGLQDDCPRCQEHAEDPISSLDAGNLRRIVRLACDRDRFEHALTRTDLVAAARVLSQLERTGHLFRTAPVEVLEFLSRYASPELRAGGHAT